MRRHTLLNSLLGGVAVLLLAAIVRTWTRKLPLIDAAAASQAPPVAFETSAVRRSGAATPALLVAAIDARDLFDPSRRGSTAEAPAPPPPAAEDVGPPPGVAVVGLRLLGSDREAVVTDGSSRQRRVRVGDDVAGYGVRRIEATQLILLSSSGREVVMPLLQERHPGLPAEHPNTAHTPAPHVGTAHAAAARSIAMAAAGSQRFAAQGSGTVDIPGQEIAMQQPARALTSSSGLTPASAARLLAEPAPLPDIRARLNIFREPRAPRPPRQERRP